MVNADEVQTETVDKMRAYVIVPGDAYSMDPIAIVVGADLADAFIDWITSDAAGDHQRSADLVAVPAYIPTVTVANHTPDEEAIGALIRAYGGKPQDWTR